MDSTELNKIAGAAIGSLLIFLLLGFFSGKVYGTRGHHHDEPQAFALEIAEPAAGGDEVVEIDYAGLIAAADLSAGKKVFGKCKGCHKVEDGKNGSGPHLWGIVDRPKEAVDGFAYSGALGAIGGNWGFAELNAFLEKPKAYAAKTSMNFGGLKKPEDRVNLIAWLNAEDGTPSDLAAGLE
ncbi:MAG: c-type cytochrome [Pseudomonadota bacterium]